MFNIFKKKEKLTLYQALAKGKVIDDFNLSDYSGFTTDKLKSSEKVRVVVCSLPNDCMTRDHEVQQKAYAVYLPVDTDIGDRHVPYGTIVVVCDEKFNAKTKKAPLVRKVLAAKAFLMFHPEASKEFALGNHYAATLHYLVEDENMPPKIAKKYLLKANKFELAGMKSLAKTYVKQEKQGKSPTVGEALKAAAEELKAVADAANEATNGKLYEAAAAASNTINAVASAAADTINEIKESVESAASDAERENISMHPSTNDEFDDEFDDDDEFDEFGEEPEVTEPDNNPQSVVIEFTTHDDTQASKYDFTKVPNLSFYPN